MERLKKIEFTDRFNRGKGQKIVCVIGSVSSGKSTLLNMLFGLKLKTGIGTTTNKREKVGEYENLRIYDAPGVN